MSNIEIWYLEHLKDLLIVCIEEIIFFKRVTSSWQGSAKFFFIKSQTVNIVGCVSPIVCWDYSTAQPYHYSIKKKKKKKKPEATYKQWE